MYGKKKSGKAKKIIITIGAVIVAVFSYFIGACLYSDDGQMVTIQPFMDNMKIFSENPLLLFNGKYLSSTFLKILLFIEVMYGLAILYWMSLPKKYMRGKEYGTAEWANVDEVNRKLMSQNPESQYQVLYTKEKNLKRKK